MLAAHRGHGLGAWIKSATLIRVNHQLGFTEDLSMENREARLADLRAFAGRD